MEAVKILDLADCPEHIQVISEWLWNEWSCKHGKSLDEVIKRTRERMNKDKVPFCLVALEGGKPIGTISVWENDLKSRQDLRPYVAVLYVEPSRRGRGIAKRLMDAAIVKAKGIGEKNLYLITELEGFYEKLGWSYLVEEFTRYGEKVRVYKLSLSDKSKD